MEHLVAHALPGTLLFRTWPEGVRLYNSLAYSLSGIVALCVMPDHVHVMCSGDNCRRFGRAVGGWTRWRNARRGESGAAVVPIPPPHALATRDKIRRSERYIHLNPCRAGLVADPLAWPLSAYRDAVGLGLRPCRPSSHEPHRLHRYIAEDESVQQTARQLPDRRLETPTLGDIAMAVASLHRRGLGVIHRRGHARTLFVRSARCLTPASSSQIAAFVGMAERSVRRVARRRDDEVHLVRTVCADPRFVALADGDLRRRCPAFLSRFPRVG